MSKKTATLNRVRTGTRATREPRHLAALPPCPHRSLMCTCTHTGDMLIRVGVPGARGRSCRQCDNSNGSMPLQGHAARAKDK
jgi:hypothetical protein